MKKLAILAVALWFAHLAIAQVITTVAGTSWLFPSSSLAASSAPLGQISGVAMDSQGNLYIADPENYLILKVTSTGTATIVAGNGRQGHSGDNGPAVNASINPFDVAVDSKGNIYIQEQSYIRVVTPAGTISTIAGDGTFGFSGDGGPATNASINAVSGLAIDSSGNLYFADTYNNRVREVAAGTITTVAGTGTAGSAGDGGKATAAQLNNPTGLAFDSFGNLYVADSLNRTIRQVSNASGIISTVVGPKQFTYPQNLAMDSKGANLYIADSGGNLVYQYSLSTKTLSNYAGNGAYPGAYSGDGGSANVARLNTPEGLVVDAAGNLYIADSANYRVREVTTGSLKINTFAGNGTFRFAGDGGQAINAQLNSPTGMAFDSAGNLYFADTANNRIRKVTPTGVISTIAGNGAPSFSGDNGLATNAALNNPTDVALDGSGNLYIADAANGLVRKVVLSGASSGTITTVAGCAQSPCPSSALAVNATLYNPVAVAVDKSGNLYIAEQSGDRISVVTAKDGKLATFAGQLAFPGYLGDGGAAVSAALNSPEGLAIDTAGNLYIADNGNNAVRMVNSSGTISTLAGGPKITSEADGPALSSEVLQPAALAVDGKGNVYVAQFDGKIRVISGGQIATVAGGGAPTILGDGGPPLSAGINQPEGLGIDGSGAVFIADTANGRVRKVIGNAAPGVTTPPPPAALPTWTLSASTLTFTQPMGGGMIPTQTVNLSPTANGTTPAVNGLNFSVAIDPSCSSWLSDGNITSGSMPAALVFTANPNGLAANTYTCNVTITAPSTASPSAVIKITLTVPPPPPMPVLGSDTPSITFTAALNSAALTQQFHVLNTGGGTLSFGATVTSSGGPWLSISTQGGTVQPSAPFAVTVTATPAALSPGTYTGSITLTGAGSTVAIPVTLTVSGPTAQMLVSESGMTFTAVLGGGAPLPHNFGILNTGTGIMDWQATTSAVVNGSFQGVSWLMVSPSSGTVNRPYLDVSLVNVTVDPSKLPGPGTYYGRVTIFSQAAINQPALITVTINVLPAGLNPGPQMYPTGLIFTGVAGDKPGSKTFQVANLSGTNTSFQTGAIPNLTPPFSYLPLNSNLGATAPSNVQVYPDFSKLAAGSQTRGTITLEFDDGSPAQSVNLLFVVAPPGSTADERTGEPRASGSCSTQPLQVVYRSPSTGFTTVVGQGTNFDVQVTDACGNLVGPSNSQSAKVNAFINGNTVPMNHIGNGVWQGTWTPSATGSITVYVQATLLVNNNLIGGQTSALSGSVTAVQQNLPSSSGAPLTTAVAHAASQSVGVPVAPGELITVYGANLASAASSSNTLPLPTSANGLQVLLGVTPLPIMFTNSNQMNVQVPYSVPLNTQYQLSVVNGTSLSVPQTVTIAAALPGIFTTNQQGSGQGVIVKQDGVTLAQSGSSAKIGEAITIYCTGLGVVTPAAKEGMPPTGAASTVNPASVSIGGVTVDSQSGLIYAGVTPGFPGLYQVNLFVPKGVQTGDSVPVSITVAGQTSQSVTMAISQ